jgi:integrase/recombinase XerD
MRYKRCKCPIWVVGRVKGEFVRKSLGVVNWEKAQRVVRDWEVEDLPPEETITVEKAADSFLQDAESRHLKESSLAKYKLLFKELKALYGQHPVEKLGIKELTDYRAQWKLSAISSRKKLERLRAFFRFCLDCGWTEKNTALLLKQPVASFKPTMPFTDEEMEKILWACEVYPNKGIWGFNNRARLKAFVLLLRWSGLRIRDAVCLRRDALEENKLFLYTQKTGVNVYVPLPAYVVKALAEVKQSNPQHFFWSGSGNPKSAVADWQRSFARLLKIAGVKGKPHMMRDTFAVYLLRRGISLEQVSILLGHSSIRITEKHYAPWVLSRQEQLEKSVKESWTEI